LPLASFIIDAHSSLSNVFILHRFTRSFLRSSSTSFIHLSLGRPLLLRPSHSRWLTSYLYPYFVCVVVFLHPSGILYMVFE
jgi:hypothetical protein